MIIGKIFDSLVFIGVTDTEVTDAISGIVYWFNVGRVAFKTSFLRGTSVPFNPLPGNCSQHLTISENALYTFGLVFVCRFLELLAAAVVAASPGHLGGGPSERLPPEREDLWRERRVSMRYFAHY